MRIVTFGETMLRLKSPGFERLLQTPRLEAIFGGSESNVAVSLAQFGMDASFVTVFPDNPLTDACIRELRGFGVHTDGIARVPGRMGVYFVEAGACQRSGGVVYDRAGSAIAVADPETIDWGSALEGADWLHVSGITPALSETAAEMTLLGMKKARERNATVSLDLNLRMNLWKYGKTPREVIPELVRLADICIASDEHISIALGIETPDGPQTSGAPDPAPYRALAKKVTIEFPNLRMLATTLRESVSADHNNLSACLYTAPNGGKSAEFHISRQYAIRDIVDRIGGGDAFDAGLIYGLAHYGDPRRALEFAVAAGCLKHSIPGDVNRVSAAEVESLAFGSGDGRIRR